MKRFLLGVSGLLLVLSAVPAADAIPPVSVFEDVDASNIFWQDIMWLHQEGITRGCNPPANDRFCPKRAVTRGEMAAFLSRALSLEQTGGIDRFVDDDDSIFEADIEKLAAAGITVGCNPPANDRFCPKMPVSRQQMASFLSRALRLTRGGGLDYFDDDEGSVHEHNIDRLRAAWVTFGCNPPSENRFCPANSVTREQMAAFLHRAFRASVDGPAWSFHAWVRPEHRYWFDPIIGTFEFANTGSEPLYDVAVVLGADCLTPSGPGERFGNGDDVFDPGEQWQYYCALHGGGHGYLTIDEASARTAEGETIGMTGYLDYDFAAALSVTVSPRVTSARAGETVLWDVIVENHALTPMVQIAEDEIHMVGGILGSFDLVDAADGDEVMGSGERWRFLAHSTVWADEGGTADLSIHIWYSPDYEPGWSAQAYGISPAISVVP